jgi:hypothetical protein
MSVSDGKAVTAPTPPPAPPGGSEPHMAAVEAELSKTNPDLGALRSALRALGHVPAAHRARVWEALLGVKNNSTKLLEAKIFNEAHDLENQRVVRLDVSRVCPSARSHWVYDGAGSLCA